MQKPIIEEANLMRKTAAAKYLQVPERTLDYLIQTGQVPYIRVGRRALRFSRDRLAQWLEEREGVEYRLRRKDSEHNVY